MGLSNLNANFQDQFAANHGFNRTAASTASLQIRGQQAPVLSQRMVRNFSGLGYQNGRQSQFTFVTGGSPRKSVIQLTEAERQGKIDNLSQFVEGVPAS